MKLAMGLLPLLVIAMAALVDGQLFKNLKKLDPSKVTVPLVKKNPAELVKDIKEKADAAVPKDLPGKIQVKDVKGKAMDKIGEAFQDLTGKSNVSEAVDATKPQQKQLAEAVARAGAALQQGADAIVNVSSSDVEGSLKDASSTVLNASDFTGIKDTLEKASKEEVAAEIRKATPQVAKALNRTSQQFAEKVKQTSPKAAAMVNRTGNKVADAIAPKRIPDHPGLPVDLALGQRSWVGLAVVLLLVLTVVSGYLLSRRFKNSQRSPVLLSDALDPTRPGDARRARDVQMTTQEPFFSQF